MPRYLKISERRTSRAKQTAKYWTKTRMTKATPIPLRIAPEVLLKSIVATDSSQSRVVAPVLPAGAQRLAAQTLEVPDITQFPFSCVGKLFMREGTTILSAVHGLLAKEQSSRQRIVCSTTTVHFSTTFCSVHNSEMVVLQNVSRLSKWLLIVAMPSLMMSI